MAQTYGSPLRPVPPSGGRFSLTRPRTPGERDSDERRETLLTIAAKLWQRAEKYGLELDEELPGTQGLRIDSRYLTSQDAMEILNVRGLFVPAWMIEGGWRESESPCDAAHISWLFRQQCLLIQACRLRRDTPELQPKDDEDDEFDEFDEDE